ncbi:hypothetical protein GCM10023161_08680 [Mycobacterium paraffinicum]|uniref:Uncharacterized protein n=1 Tax=Mycobacterium paraffinicum TaxID=53378 RepID=A0ABP8RCI1_9MYCO
MCASHSTQVSYGSTRRAAPATEFVKGAKDNTSIICTVRHTFGRANAPQKSHSLRAFNVTERLSTVFAATTFRGPTDGADGGGCAWLGRVGGRHFLRSGRIRRGC